MSTLLRYLVDHFSVRALDSDVDVEESALGDLEHEAHLGAHLDLVEKTFFRVSVNLEELNLRKYFLEFRSFLSVVCWSSYRDEVRC